MDIIWGSVRRDVVTVSGSDAVAYLQGQLSQDVAALGVGECRASFVLAPQGKVDGWGRVLRTADDAFEIDVDPGAGEAWDARLRRFLLRTKAEISVQADVPVVAVRGAAVDGGRPVAGPGVVGVDLFGVATDIAPAGLPQGARSAGAGELEAWRIRAGIPVWGAELDADTIPATVGQWAIDASVSFTKGCYTGQELVARIDSRGGNVPRHLRGLLVQGPAPAMGASVVLDGAEIATVTSSAPSGAGSVALCFAPRSVELPAPGPSDSAGLPVVVAGSPATLHLLPLLHP